MEQFEWYSDVQNFFRAGETVINIVTSGDIDSVIIHMFDL